MSLGVEDVTRGLQGSVELIPGRHDGLHAGQTEAEVVGATGETVDDLVDGLVREDSFSAGDEAGVTLPGHGNNILYIIYYIYRHTHASNLLVISSVWVLTVHKNHHLSLVSFP